MSRAKSEKSKDKLDRNFKGKAFIKAFIKQEFRKRRQMGLEL